MKSVLITGANSGFGYLMALKFARNGDKVYATTRSLEKEGVKELNDIAKKEDLNISWLVLDVTDDESIKTATKGIESLDVLINNAGYGAIGPLESFSVSDFQTQLETNLVGIHRMVLRFLPVMKKQKYGKIINFGSIASRVAFVGYSLYAASKYGVVAYTEVLRQETAKFGIDVCVVEPGGFNTNFDKNIVKGEASNHVNELTNKVEKLKRVLVDFGLFAKVNNPQKVADLVYKLALKKTTRLHNLVGLDAKIIAFYKKWIPDILWDYLVRMLVK